MIKRVVVLVAAIMLLPSLAGALELYQNGDVSLNVGYWGQAWYQYVSDYDTDKDGRQDDRLHDFMIRRSYFSIKGTATPRLGFFMHYAADRLGQKDLDNSGMGLGSGLAVRDAWVNYKVSGDDFMVQVGRMYIPFTRNYGTTSTKALLTTELDWGQGGIRSGIFYPSKVGRDDSVTFWGNVLEDKFQYRLMVGEGVEHSAGRAVINPDDSLRFAGRVSYNFLDPETGWFNKGTSLGKQSVIALGAGFDYQQDLEWGAKEEDYLGITADLHVDMPMGDGAVTADLAYIKAENSVNPITDSDLAGGEDCEMITGQLGYLLAGNIQPFVHAEAVLPEAGGTDDTMVCGVGCNYYIKGLANKLTAEWSTVDSDSSAVEDKDIVTVQAAFGF